jgi:hypothetical protein
VIVAAATIVTSAIAKPDPRPSTEDLLLAMSEPPQPDNSV